MLQHHSMTINTMEAMDTMEGTPTIAAEEDVVRNTEENGAVVEVVWATVI